MRTCFLHAGMPKAASTLFQAEIANNQQNLAEVGINILSRYQRKQKHKVISQLLSSPQTLREVAVAIAKEATHLASDILITSEELFYPFHTLVPSLREALEREGLRLKFLVILRTQPDHIASAYGENIRLGHKVGTFDQFVTKRINKQFYDYYEYIVDFCKNNKLNVYITSLSLFISHPMGNTLSSFFERNVEIQHSRLTAREGLSREMITTLALLGPFRAKINFSEFLPYVIALDRDLSLNKEFPWGEKANFLTKEQYNYIYLKYVDSNIKTSRCIAGGVDAEEAFPYNFRNCNRLDLLNLNPKTKRMMGEIIAHALRRDLVNSKTR